MVRFCIQYMYVFRQTSFFHFSLFLSVLQCVTLFRESKVERYAGRFQNLGFLFGERGVAKFPLETIFVYAVKLKEENVFLSTNFQKLF